MTMTREEEIRKQASKYGKPEYLLQTPNILGEQGFIQGQCGLIETHAKFTL